ncbi:MAG: site-specific integrase [Gammaproteobacteria bacterium]|nr:site-specific integrase [Gammaproteobacteria bacterium]
MKKRPTMLTATFVRTVNTPGRYGDGRGGLGLTLLVQRSSRRGLCKSWGQSVRIGGRRTTIGLGRYPVVTLARARERALENARVIDEGRDPRQASTTVPTFAKALETVIAIHAENWKDRARSEHQWRASLRDYAMPRLADKPVDEIDTADVMAVLLPIWSAKRVTAKRVRQRIAAVMKWAVAQGYREDNPAGDAIAAALPKTPVVQRHQRALPHAEVGAAIARVRRSRAYRGTVLAFEFLVLTACRNGEVRGTRWDEVDTAGAVWTIPAERMKAAREHRVPLSPRALDILDEARQLAHHRGLVFPSPTGRTLSQSTMPSLLRDLQIGAVPHGFRSSFRDWAAECTDYPREVCELALAHVNSDRVEAAYRRSDLFEKRRTLMDDWALYVVSTG